MKSTTATRPACAGCAHDYLAHSVRVGCLQQLATPLTPGGAVWCPCDAYTAPVPAIALARRTDPGTSHAAAASLTPETLRASQAAVLELLRLAGARGLTDQFMAELYPSCVGGAQGYPAQSESGLRTRRAELVRGGLVVDTGRRERLESGRQAVVWAIA